MSPPSRYVTIVIHSDGSIPSRTYRLPRWGVRVMMGSAIGLGAAILLGLALYLPMAATAARVPGLVRQVERLEDDNRKIGDLVAALDRAERRYDRIRGMLGADIVPDPVQLASTLPVAPVIRARPRGQASAYETGLSQPSHWPLEEPGFVTRGQAGDASTGNLVGEAHPGIDIAVPIGSPVRASGGGTVLQTGDDPEYGIFVLLEHPEGLQSMYGHLSRAAVAPGQAVDAGEVVGLSGNTGRSSAPHLHFEIRRDGKAIDPRTLVKEQS